MSIEEDNRGAKITVHWLEKSRSQRILFLLEYLGLSYDLQVYKRGSNNIADTALKNVHPLGKSPVITVQHENLKEPLVMAESGLIVEYLTEHFGGKDKGLIPKKWKEGKEGQIAGEADEWLRYRYFMHYAEGSLMSLLVLALVMSQIRAAPVPFFIKPITRSIANNVHNSYIDRNLDAHFSFLESQLSTTPSDGTSFCGKHFTGADALLIFPLEAALGRALLAKDEYPKIAAWVERMHNMESYKRAVDRIKKETGHYDPTI